MVGLGAGVSVGVGEGKGYTEGIGIRIDVFMVYEGVGGSCKCRHWSSYINLLGIST
jgi:hypothetical protein